MTAGDRPAQPTQNLEPRWVRDQARRRYGPGYRRHVPGEGILLVGCGSRGSYSWWLQQGGTLIGPCGEGFPDPQEAMQAADRGIALLPPRMFAELTTGEAQELYNRLTEVQPPYVDRGGPRANDWYFELRDLRNEAWRQLEFLAAAPVQATAASPGPPGAPCVPLPAGIEFPMVVRRRPPARVTADSSNKTVGAGGPQALSSLDFPNTAAPGAPAWPAAPRGATGQAGRPPARRAL